MLHPSRKSRLGMGISRWVRSDHDNLIYSQIGTVTERGCLGSATDAELCDPTKNCEKCAVQDGSACNSVVFPADRRKCVVGTLANQYCPNPWDNCVQIASSTTGGRWLTFDPRGDQ